VATIRRPANGPSPDIMTGHGQHVALTLRLRYREGEGSLTHLGEFGDVDAAPARRMRGACATPTGDPSGIGGSLRPIPIQPA